MDFSQQQYEAKAIRSDMQKAFAIIKDAKYRYIKSKLRLRSKKQAADAEQLFADLAIYESRGEIQNSYGYAEISRAKYERLLHLWDEREQHTEDGKKYSDRVIEMLEKAMSHIGDGYEDFLFDADMMARENERNQQGRFPKGTS